MKKTLTLSLCGIICLSLLTASGCVSSMLGRKSGDKMIWWCDVTQSQVGNPDEHVPGMTKFDKKSGKDIPMTGVTPDEIKEVTAERKIRKGEIDAIPEQAEEKSRLGWLKRNKPETEKTNKSMMVDPTPTQAPAQLKAPQEPVKSKWMFWR